MNKKSVEALDDIDLLILDRLQQTGRVTHTQLAQHINLSQPAIHNRIKRLEKLGFIQEYVALLDREQMGY